MNTDQFWSLIEKAREGDPDCSEQSERLMKSLVTLSADEILGFQQQLWQRLAESCRWDLWAVAYIVNGGCSDDGFEYFRGWLISQGRQYFEAAIQDPERAADRAEQDANECEEILSVAAEAYEEKIGEPVPHSGFRLTKDPSGTPWDEDKLPELYPDLYKRFF